MIIYRIVQLESLLMLLSLSKTNPKLTPTQVCPIENLTRILNQPVNYPVMDGNPEISPNTILHQEICVYKMGSCG